MSKKIKCEYVWIDGTEPTQSLRSKTKVINEVDLYYGGIVCPPDWSFDGSSTMQAETQASECILKPVFACEDPLRKDGFIVLCEVYNEDNKPHKTNHRAKLIESLNNVNPNEPFIGFEQEYFFYDTRVLPDENETPLGWPVIGEPSRGQGPYYCAVGMENISGRNIAEEHMDACIKAGLSICGINAEVALGQWEFQIGGPGVPLDLACDHLIVARYLLYRLGEYYRVKINIDPKPVEGDWNGSGMHANFSTKEMREPDGMTHIINACEKLGTEDMIKQAIDSYGHDLAKRLTGKHETSNINEFSYGVSDRTTSVRIPLNVKMAGCGYFEDRRPNSNACPYLVAKVLVDSL